MDVHDEVMLSIDELIKLKKILQEKLKIPGFSRGEA